MAEEHNLPLSVEGDHIEGDKVLGDKIVVGDVDQSVVAIGEGAQIIYHNVERALSSVELADQAAQRERRLLAEKITAYVQRLQRQAEAARVEGTAAGSPYKALLSYDFGDAPLFYGRTAEIAGVLDRLGRGPLTVLHAGSGTGKTSLLKAGIMPRLLANGDVPLYVRPYQTPAHYAIKRGLLTQLEETPDLAVTALHDFLRMVTDLLGGGRLVVIIDQAEELFTVQSAQMRADFVSELAPCLADTLLPVRWLLALRGEWFTQLGTFRPQVPDPFANEYLLGPLTPDQAREVIVQPAAHYGVTYEAGLVDKLVSDLGEREIAPPQLQLVCSALFDNLAGEKIITAALYDSLGGTSGILRSHLERVLRRNVPADQRTAARHLLEALITSEGRRALRTGEDLAAELAVLGVDRATFSAVLQVLVDSRLLRVEEVDINDSPAVVYELAHDYLLAEIELDPATQARKAAQELLFREVESYRQYGTLLDEDEMAIIAPHLGQLPLDDDTRALLDASRSRLEQMREEEERRRKAELMRLRIYIGVLAVLGIIAAFFGALATRSARSANLSATQVASERDRAQLAESTAEAARISAEEAEQRALEQAAFSKSLALAAQAELELAGLSPERGVLLALEALERYAYSPQAERVLARAVQTLRLRDTETIDRVVVAEYSPDGSAVLVAGGDGTARLLDAVSHEVLRVYSGHTGAVNDAAFSPGGERIATAGADQTAKVWETDTGVILLSLDHGVAVTRVAFSPDGQFLVTAGNDNVARVWNAATGTLLLRLEGHTEPVLNAAYSPDGTRIITTSADDTAIIWDAVSGELLQTLIGHGGDVYSAAFSPDGTRVVTSGQGGTVYLWDPATGVQLSTVARHGEAVYHVAYRPDGQAVVTASSDGTARVWNVFTGQQILSFIGHVDVVYTAAYSPDGMQVATAGLDNTVRFWDADPGAELLDIPGSTTSGLTADYSPDGARIASANMMNAVVIWDLATGTQALTLEGHLSGLTAVTYSPDGTRIATASRDGTLRVWDAQSGAELLSIPFEGPWNVAFSPDGTRLVATAVFSPTARVFDAATGEALLTIGPLTDWLRMAVYSPDGTRIAGASWDNTARVWDAATGQELLTLVGHVSDVYDVGFSPDSSRLITASRDGTVRIWDASSGAELLSLVGHTSVVYSAEYSLDGRRIVTASRDGLTKVWDAATGQELLTITSGAGWAYGAIYHPAGSQVATIYANGTVKGWRVWPTTQSLIDYARQCCVFRELTDRERVQFGLPLVGGAQN